MKVRQEGNLPYLRKNTFEELFHEVHNLTEQLLAVIIVIL